MTTIAILDTAHDMITRLIAAHPPEKGGALLGIIGEPFVTRLIPDEHARTTGASYQPSRELAAQVKETELSENLEFKGVVHSHPGAMDRPSGQDERELKVGLDLNPHMPFYLVPIVTTVPPSEPLGPHELACGGGKISFFAAYRSPQGARVRRVPVREVPMQQDMEMVRAAFGGSAAPKVFVTNVEGVEMVAARLQLDGLELLVLTSSLYPAVAPLFLVTDAAGATEQVQAPWLLALPPDERLLAAVRTFLSPPGPYRRAFGLPNLPALTADLLTAGMAGWKPTYTGRDPAEAVHQVQDGLFARSAGLLSRALQSKMLLAVGLGSVGSYVTEQMVRGGVGRVVLIDAETVEAANLSRTVYTVADLGAAKADALARRLLQINPGLEIIRHVAAVQDLAPDVLAPLVGRADLVLAATDEGRAQRLMNHWAYAHGKPAVFPALYAGAQGGEVIVTVPERTPCFLCATRLRHAAEQSQPVSAPTDYGTGRLVGEVALGADVQHLASAAVKMALCLLLPPDADARLKGFLEPQLEAGANYMTMAMTPGYWFYPQLFGDTPGQFAYQSVWMTPERVADCPVCGETQYRADPADAVRRAPLFKPGLLRAAAGG